MKIKSLHEGCKDDDKKHKFYRTIKAEHMADRIAIALMKRLGL